MGFLERSRSLRRKDSAVPLRIKTEQSPATRIAVKETNTPVRNTPVRSTPATPRDGTRPSTTGKTASGAQKDKEAGRPRTAGRASEREQQPPMPEYHSFKFPNSQESPRASASHSRNLTLHTNGSMQALDSPRKAPEYKRSFTTPMHVPQASIHKGTVKLSSKDLPKLEPMPAPAQKKQPTLHKSKSSTWRSLFQRKQSKPPIPDFDPNEFVSQSPAKQNVPALPALPALPAPSSKVQSKKQMALPAPPPKITGHVRTESRGMARQTMRAELDKASFDKNSGPTISKTPAGSRRVSLKQERPQISRSTTEASLAVSEQYFDAISNASGSPRSAVERGPRLEISIPTVELERYSVMFEKLLKPKQSLLERRKTAIQGLSLPGEGPEAGRLTPSLDTPGGTLQRRATSPNLMTPMTAQFLESSSQMATPVAIHRVSAAPPRILLRRSHTAPPGAISPGPAQFDTKEKMPQRQQQQEAGDNTASACSTRNSPMWSEASLPATPDTTSSDTATFMSFNDDDDEEEEYEVSEAQIVTHDSKAFKPTLKEPSWEMITRSPSSTSSTALPPPIPPKAPGRASREPSRERLDQHPPRTSSLDSSNSGGKQSAAPQQHIITQSQVHPNPLQSHQVRRPVQISIARQISVRPPGASQSQQKTPMSVQPVYSKQPLRPKVVEVRNRKSTMIVLESASSSASVSRESLLPPPAHR